MGYNKEQAEKELRRAGAKLLRHGANHDIWMVNEIRVVIPRHKGKDLSRKVKDDVQKAIKGIR